MIDGTMERRPAVTSAAPGVPPNPCNRPVRRHRRDAGAAAAGFARRIARRGRCAAHRHGVRGHRLREPVRSTEPGHGGEDHEPRHLAGGCREFGGRASRLGLSVGLDAAFATDTYGEYVWRTLRNEGVDLSGSVQFADWATPITVSLVYASDRSMITYERPQPAPVERFLDPGATPSRAVFVTLGADAAGAVARGSAPPARASSPTSAGTQPNTGTTPISPGLPTSMRSCRTASRRWPTRGRTHRRRPPAGWWDAFRSSWSKCGSDGSICWRAGDPAPVREPAIDVQAVDPTGAGDVFDAAFIFGTLAGWGVKEALRFGNLCAGLSVQHYGGSLSAPSWDEVAAWIRSRPDGAALYGFLDPYIGRVSECAAPQRAGRRYRRRRTKVMISRRVSIPDLAFRGTAHHR